MTSSNDPADQWASDATAEILRTIADSQAITVKDGRAFIEFERDGVYQPPLIGYTVKHIMLKHAAALVAAARLADYVEPHVTEHGKGPMQVGSIGIESKDLLFLVMLYRAERNNARAAP